MPRPPRNPATSDATPYTAEQAAFLTACARYRSTHGRQFLLATDYLAILLELGYRKGAEPGGAAGSPPAG